jgi:uncharacterized protein YjbI with pentapeptide repeats
MAQVCSSLLVPLMIAVFTIVTTMLQMNLAKQQREQDLHIANENRAKDFEIANQTRVSENEIEDRRRAAEITAQRDQQMNIVLAAYLKDMAELLLSTNFSLTNKVIATVVRAKTLTTLGQLDGKRKAHIVRFLYEAQMITVGEPSIDLTDADFSSVDLTNYKLVNASFVGCNLFGAIFHKTSLLKVDFEKAKLSVALFDNSALNNVNFHEANLTGASFIGANLFQTSFIASLVTNTDFTGVNAQDLICIDIKGNNTIFKEASMYHANFICAILFNASFAQTRLQEANMNNATLVYANFTNADLSRTNFGYSNLSESIFDQSNCFWTSFYRASLVATKWLGTNVANVDFSYANLSSASITDDQIRLAHKIFGIILPNGTRSFLDTNLLINGNAEGLNGTCDTSPWHVNSMIAVKNSDLSEHIYDQCFFTRQSNTTTATMWQRVQVPNAYAEWIRTDVAIIQITGNYVSTFASYMFTATLSDFAEQESDD